MAPVLRARQSLPKDKFSSYFGGLRSQPYNDPNSSRGGSHTYGFILLVRVCRCGNLLLTGAFCRLRAIAWNPLGTLVATGSADKTLRVCTFHLVLFLGGQSG